MVQNVFVLLVGVIFTVFSNPVIATSCVTYFGDGPAPARPALIAIDSKSANGKIDWDAIAQERHTLFDLLDGDPARNLVLKHPGIVMNSFQRANAWINQVGIQNIVVLGSDYVPKKRNVYRLFSESIPPVNDGKYIVGQYEAIEAYAQALRQGASGDEGARRKVLVFMGPSATGKSEFIKIMLAAGKNMTARDPNHFLMTFDWVNLHEIPELREYLDIRMDGDKMVSLPVPSPLPGQSPFVLLPVEYQQALIETARAKVEKLSGFSPQPIENPDPKSAFIREKILAFYAEKKGRTLTFEEKTEILNQYVRVKRFVVGANGKDNVVEYQGKEVNWDALTVGRNAYVFAAKGANHPMSWNPGKLLEANGSFLFFDELLRQEEQFQDFLLAVAENRRVTREGAPVYDLDAPIAGAANYETKAKKPPSDAFSSRTREVPMLLSSNPQEIEKTLILMKGQGRFLMRKLAPYRTSAAASREWSPYQPEQVFPLITPDPYRSLSADRRFVLAVEGAKNESPVIFSPHALTLMSYTIAASRMATDPAAALASGLGGGIANSLVFTNPIERLKLRSGETTLSPQLKHELDVLTAHLREGEFGIDMRDAANTWLSTVIDEARRPENQNMVTPELIRSVFRKLLNEDGELMKRTDGKTGFSKGAREETRKQWLELLDQIMDQIVARRIQEDIYAAMGSGLGSVEMVYDEIFHEILAISQQPELTNPKADRARLTQYTTASGEVVPIKWSRFDKIFQQYSDTYGETLPMSEILAYSALHNDRSSGNSPYRRHEKLLAAIRGFYAARAIDTVSISAILSVASGAQRDVKMASIYAELLQALEIEYGYTKEAALKGLALVDYMENQRQAKKQQTENGR